jgi:hypothetical protein
MSGTTWGSNSLRRDDRSTFGGRHWRAIRFAEANPNSLSIRHANHAPQTIQNVVLRSHSIRLVDEIDKATFLLIAGCQ